MKVFLVVLSILLFGLSPNLPRAEMADLIFVNGNIYTANDKQAHADAVAVKADRIVFVGSNSDAQKFIGKSTRVVDLHGQTVLPGLTDAHCHLTGIGEREMTLNLEGITNLQDFLAK